MKPLRQRTRRTLFLCLFVSCCGVMMAAVAARQGSFRHERQVVTSGPGPQRLPIDVPLLAGGARFRVVNGVAREGLADLRLFTGDGTPIPHLLLYAPPREPRWIRGSVLPILATEKTSGFEADLGASTLVDAVAVDGLPAPFLKRLALEGSGDRQRWTALAPEGTLFDLPAEGLTQTDLPFEAGRYRYLRVTWHDTNSGRMPLPRAVRARAVTGAPRPGPLTEDVAFVQRPSEPGRSRYTLSLPGARLPIVAITLSVPATHVFRTASVFESRIVGGEAVPVEVGSAGLRQVVRDGVAAGELRIPVTPPAEAQLELVIDDGSNAPLALAGVTAVFAELPWIYFDAPRGVVLARYGNPAASAPSFDLEAARDTIDLRTVPDAGWGVPRPSTSAVESELPGDPPTGAGATLDPGGFLYTRRIGAEGRGLFTLPLDAAVLAQSRGPASRFADVRVADADGRQVPYLLERRDEPLVVDLAFSPVTPPAASARSGITGHESAYRVPLPYAGLPDARLVIETAARVFRRNVRVAVERPADRQRRAPWLDVVAAVPWVRADQPATTPTLVVPVRTGNASEMLLIVEEGDNAPLPIAAVRLLLPSYRLRFYRVTDAPLRLLYGKRDAAPPRYDLALLASRVMGAEAREATLEGPPAPPAGEPPFISRPLFYLLLAAAVLVLLALIARLAMRHDKPDGASAP